jgi:hypothetical protein
MTERGSADSAASGQNLGQQALRVFTMEPAEAAPDIGQVVRYLGYPPDSVPHNRVLERVQRTLGSFRFESKGTCAVYQVLAGDSRRLALPGAEFRGAVGEYLGPARQVAVFVATAGPDVMKWAAEANSDGDVLGALVFSAIGSHVAEIGVERIASDLRSRLGLGDGLSMPYSPGYCGISLEQQATLFRLVDASRIGVELLPSMIMNPLKSVSGLIGIGAADQVDDGGCPCDRCTHPHCDMRRGRTVRPRKNRESAQSGD